MAEPGTGFWLRILDGRRSTITARPASESATALAKSIFRASGWVDSGSRACRPVSNGMIDAYIDSPTQTSSVLSQSGKAVLGGLAGEDMNGKARLQRDRLWMIGANEKTCASEAVNCISGYGGGQG